MSDLIQYVILRSDLCSTYGWTLGAVIAQACHASVAALTIYGDEPGVIKYLEDLNNMRKVVLEVKNESELILLSRQLDEHLIDFKKWVEQPENVPTCLACKPYPKDAVYKYVKHLKLFK